MNVSFKKVVAIDSAILTKSGHSEYTLVYKLHFG